MIGDMVAGSVLIALIVAVFYYLWKEAGEEE